ncbi:MAG: ATP-binding protein [Thermoproteota archaeon]
MPETRVELKHSLENIRDDYPYPIEEAIITELIANALDADASSICFLTNDKTQTLTCIDNGKGMTPKELEEYHNIAASSKVRGTGIGFAGVGAKLALLIAESVVTETKRIGELSCATKWYLESDKRAPWDYINSPGLVSSPSGTAVSIVIRDRGSHLLKEGFIKKVIQTHFYPLLDKEFINEMRKIYLSRGVVEFFVNGKKIGLLKTQFSTDRKMFFVRLGKRGKFVGIGFLGRSDEELPEENRGIAVSTYGKIIKRGWEWIGIAPRNPMHLTGIVEIPDLAEILTTNKADFLKDSTSLQKFYRYRKAIQSAMEPILQEFGEIRLLKPEDELRPLEREIESVLEGMLDDFPELNPLLGRRRRAEAIKGVIPDPNAPLAGIKAEGVDVMTGSLGGSGEGSGIEAAPGALPGERIEPSPEPTERGQLHEGRRRRPGLIIGLDDDPNRPELAWLSEDGVHVNKAHPAYQRAKDKNYHIVTSVAWVLSSHLEPEKSPQDFINRFLSSWGSGR